MSRRQTTFGKSGLPLTRRQKEILEYIRSFMAEQGYSPSLEEIGARFGVASPSAVFKHLNALEQRGAIRRRPHSARSIELAGWGGAPPVPLLQELPLLGVIAAGQPIEALENAETVQVPPDLTGRGTHYVLRVRGDSMTGEYIADGDFVIVRETQVAENGDMVVALVKGEQVTLKRYYREGSYIRLQPSNPAMAPIVVDENHLQIRGVVVGVMRKYR